MKKGTKDLILFGAWALAVAHFHHMSVYETTQSTNIIMKRIISFCTVLLSASLLQADVTRTEIGNKGGWSVNAVKDEDGKLIKTEMVRDFAGKQEISFRMSFTGEKFHIDTSSDWSGLPDAKSHPAEYRVDEDGGDPLWKGNAIMVEDPDGKPWLRITEPNEPGVGDAVSNGDTFFLKLGKAGSVVLWEFDLSGSNWAYKAMVDSFLGHPGALPIEP